MALAWLVGASFLAARLALACARQRLALRGLSPVTRRAALDALASCTRALGLHRAPALLAGPGIAAPCLAGCLRPRILLPQRFAGEASIEDLHHVLLHEIAHVRRRDVATSWLLALLEALHWFNPVVRWAFARAREARELACDALVLDGSAGGDGRAYAATLVRVLEAATLAPRPRAALGIDGARTTERRIRWLVEGRHGRGSRLVTALALAICGVLGLTDCRKLPAPQDLEMRIYDVGPLLDAPQDFRVVALGLRKPAVEGQPPEAEEVEATRAKRLAELATLIKERLGRDGQVDGTVIDLDEGRLRVRATVAVHDAVRAILDRRLAEKDIVVAASFKLLSLDDAALAGAPARVREALRDATGGSKTSLTGLAAAEVEGLMGLRRADGSSPVLYSPSVTAFNRQLTHTLVVNQSAHIADLKKTEREGQTAFEPVIEVLNVGVTIQLRAEVSEDRKTIAFDIRYEWADAAEPIETITVEGFPLAVPEMHLSVHDAELEAPAGTWVAARADRIRVPPKTRGANGPKPEWTEETLILLVKGAVHGRADVESR